MDDRRLHIIAHGPDTAGPVVYWMHRDHRARDNWSLLHALDQAARTEAPACVAYCLAPTFLGAGRRQFTFLLKGLQRTEELLRDLGLPLLVRTGEPGTEIPRLVRELDASLLVTDFDPVRIKRGWIEAVRQAIEQQRGGRPGIQMVEVDSRNVVPCRAASDKAEYMARTLRPKIHRLLPDFLVDFPAPPKPAGWPYPWPETDWHALLASSAQGALGLPSIPKVDRQEPGEDEGLAALRAFVSERLPTYATRRNDPVLDATSHLSPYLHFGQLSAQRVALEVRTAGRDLPAAEMSVDAFLEQLLVRRELSDNFCLHHPDYDSVDAFPAWSRATLDKHRQDRRPVLYGLDELEQARTDDPLWNAAQAEMVQTGRMHGYMRMYWGKKLLEWTESPEQALSWAIRLNDRYQLDGRDTNGYAGIAWAIGGVHDRPWPERPVFGTIRYMNSGGARRKFDVDAYIRRFPHCQNPAEPRGSLP